jgi:hypothetical protein
MLHISGEEGGRGFPGKLAAIYFGSTSESPLHLYRFILLVSFFLTNLDLISCLLREIEEGNSI